MAADFGTTLNALPTDPLREQRFFLAVISEGDVHSAPLPERGAISMGRGDQNNVWIDDPTMSRQHAILHVDGARFELEDLGGANGTSISRRTLQPRERAPLDAGQIFELASTMFVIQRRASVRRPRRMWPHGYLEMRLEEELGRARPRAFTPSLMWIRVEGDDAEAALEEALADVLEPSDVVAKWAEREYEVLLFDGASRVESVKARIEESLAKENAHADFGVAVHPKDGATADALISSARAAAQPETKRHLPATGPIAEDRAMRDLFQLATKVARGKIAVLVLGETGVGKEVLAEAIHRASPRAAKPYLRLNCAALSESLLESELFGYEKGAFTGADRAKPGLLEAAEGGTIFLDEVGEMAPGTQVKLLRALEQKEVMRVGALKPRSFDVRFVAATNRDLEEEILRGAFRKDLYFRLAGAVLTIPPLRERKSELALFAERFTNTAAVEAGIEPVPRISAEARAALFEYAWPGNLRELRNAMERAVLLCGDGPILPEHLPLEKMNARWLDPPPESRAGPDLSDSELDERDRLVRALDQCGGNQSRAAKMLGIPRRTFLRRVEKYDLPRPRKEGG